MLGSAETSSTSFCTKIPFDCCVVKNGRVGSKDGGYLRASWSPGESRRQLVGAEQIDGHMM